MADSINGPYNPGPTLNAQVGITLKSMISDMKYKPIESYTSRIIVSAREKTPQEIEIEEIATKYNL
jgi:uncharacterized protein (DUF2147 family)